MYPTNLHAQSKGRDRPPVTLGASYASMHESSGTSHGPDSKHITESAVPAGVWSALGAEGRSRILAPATRQGEAPSCTWNASAAPHPRGAATSYAWKAMEC